MELGNVGQMAEEQGDQDPPEYLTAPGLADGANLSDYSDSEALDGDAEIDVADGDADDDYGHESDSEARRGSPVALHRGLDDEKSKSMTRLPTDKQYYALINDPSFLEDPDAYYPENVIVSSKYTVLTFIPLNLFEQFRRIANIYFLMIIAILTVPGIAPFSIWTSVGPLMFILAVGAIKDGIEDYHRHQDDDRANSLPVLRLEDSVQPQTFVEVRAADIKVGDIVLIERGQEISADCIVLSSNNPDGTCYINTASLDGENAPKLRRAVRLTSHIDKAQDFVALRGKIQCPQNSKSLHGFAGNITISKRSLAQKKKRARGASQSEDEDDTDYLYAQTSGTGDQRDKDSEDSFLSALGDEHFIFRGSKLANTEYVYAYVLFVGPQTKLMLNRNQVPFKFSKFERILNQCIASILVFNFLLCIGLGIAANESQTPFHELKRDDKTRSFIMDTATWLVITSWMIPFSLYVTMELVKMIQAQWVTWDDNLVYWHGDAAAMAAMNARGGNGGPDDRRKKEHEYIPSMTDGIDGMNESSSHTDFAAADGMGGTLERRTARVKNSNLNEELGHVDYVFSDKTGTLTQNQMELCKCSIRARKYQNDIRSTESSSPNASVQMNEEFLPLSDIVREIFRREERNRKSQSSADRIPVVDDREVHFFWNLLVCGATLPVAKHRVLNYADVTPAMTKQLTQPVGALQPVGYGSTLQKQPSKKQTVNDHSPQPEDEKEEPRVQRRASELLGEPFREEEIEYMSPSPDEVAFAEALADHGVVLEERDSDGVLTVRLHPNRKHVRRKGALSDDDHSFIRQFRVLAVLDFDASRKRMTVIVEDEQDNIFLYTKGADNVIFNMCTDRDKNLILRTKRHVTSFARGGSRTLVCAFRQLSREQFEDFDREFRKAEVALTRRSDRIEKAFSLIEHSLLLLGCTAVEDQMQEGVPLTVRKLKEANIQVVMITGDKQETAVSIGRQSGIIGETVPNSELMFISARAPQDPDDTDALERQMLKVEGKLKQFSQRCQRKYEDYTKQQSEEDAAITDGADDFSYGQKGPLYETALIINGDALEMALHPELVERFIELFTYCTAVVCNRANPAQKAMLVSMAKSKLKGVALAIGDGANDVSMIQAANVGVGIMGKEGTQAALASDFVIHRFKHLSRLLFVHGRFSFCRTSSVVMLSLYKNMAFNIALAYYGFYSLFTAQTMFDPQMMSAFNLLFTALFPLVVGAFEQDIDDETAMNHPKAYHYFKMDSFFDLPTFLFWMWTAIWQSVFVFWSIYLVVEENGDMWDDTGVNGGIWAMGTQMLTAITTMISLKMMAETRQWNWTYYAATFLGIGCYFCSLAVVCNSIDFDPDMWRVMEWTFKRPICWVVMLLQLTVCLLPGILYNLYQRENKATLSIVLNEAEKFGYLTVNGEHRPTKDVVEDYLKR